MEEKKTNGNSFVKYTSYVDGRQELSERTFNMIIGLMMVWGFALNFLLVKTCSNMMISLLVEYGKGAMIGMLIGYFALCFGGSFLLKSDEPVKCFIGFNMIAVPIGLLLSIFVIGYDANLVYNAVLVTAIVTLVMMIAATIVPQFFLKIGSALGISLLAVIIVELVMTFVFRMDLSFIDYIVALIFCGFIGFDWARANAVQRTVPNAISAAGALYLDIINLFIRILSIMGNKHND